MAAKIVQCAMFHGMKGEKEGQWEENLMAWMEPYRILVITGGFHTPGIRERLSGSGWEGCQDIPIRQINECRFYSPARGFPQSGQFRRIFQKRMSMEGDGCLEREAHMAAKIVQCAMFHGMKGDSSGEYSRNG